MKSFKRITVAFFAVLILIASCPVSAFAVDPVSAATMANALAQAITAYGASQGVSVMYDVSSTDGIGEGMHDLWEDFKTDINDNDVPTYDSLAVTLWGNMYQKIGDYVGINLADTTVSYFDAFWNWLLSGPAEMTKVDNDYYEWSVVNGSVAPIPILANTTFSIDGNTAYSSPFSYQSSFQDHSYFADDVFFYVVTPSGSSSLTLVVVSSSSSISVNHYLYNRNNGASSTTAVSISSRSYGSYYYGLVANFSPVDPSDFTVYSSTTSAQTGANTYWYLENVFGAASSADISTSSDGLSVQPYIGETSPDRIYIPDNEDVNYTPLPYTGPVNVPWLNELFGPGSGTLTDAQAQSIANAIDDQIEDTGTVELADTAPPPVVSEVYIPFLPVTVPSFNFSLSGIWHYVTEWVSSLGAWFTMMFTIWSNLPYAISLPVYATAVVVIVLGVYKRFFM